MSTSIRHHHYGTIRIADYSRDGQLAGRVVNQYGDPRVEVHTLRDGGFVVDHVEMIDADLIQTHTDWTNYAEHIIAGADA